MSPILQDTVRIYAFVDSFLSSLEEELHTKIYPGTEIMADFGSHHFVKSSLHSKQVLVPQPSSDKHDPLVCSHAYFFQVV